MKEVYYFLSQKGVLMHRCIKIVFVPLCLMFFATEVFSATPTKMYELQSGIVEYDISGGGSMMGIKTSTKGSKTLFFKDWGNINVMEEVKTVETNGKGKQEKSLAKFDNGTVYSVDAEEKVIIKMDMQDALNSMGQGKSSMTQAGRDMMQQMGGKKIGEENILGYPCEVWEFQWGKIWGHKGIPLKTQSTMMGITHLEMAKKVQFGVTAPSSKFTLPSYPMRSMDEMMMQGFDKNSMNNTEDMTPQERKELQELMKNMGGIFGK